MNDEKEKIKIGVIGGSGLYNLEGTKYISRKIMPTPYGEPSDEVVIVEIENKQVAFLPRHAKGHKILPTEVPNQANIYFLKSLGVERIISISAVGSLKEEIKPRDIVIPDQLFDMTKKRNNTFFGAGAVAHISFADPYCLQLNNFLKSCAEKLGYEVHLGGTYLCIEGPQFSTRAESRIYRQLGMSVIGMTNAPEAKLAREAQICYSTLAVVTDYDVWFEGEEDVTAEMVLENLNKGIGKVKEILREAILNMPDERVCNCAKAIECSIITDKEYIPPSTKERLFLLLKDYL